MGLYNGDRSGQNKQIPIFVVTNQVVADVKLSNLAGFSNVYKFSNGSYLNLATFLGLRILGLSLFNVLLEQMHGFPYNLKQGNMNMTSQLFPSPRKAHIKMVIFNFSDFKRQKVIQ